LPSTTKATAKKKKVFSDNEDDEQDKSSKKTKQPLVKINQPNYWVEYFDESENEWFSAHPMIKDLCASEQIEKYCPFNYVLSIDRGLWL
jgi:hypothetical protein